jgi:chitinase
MSTYLLPITLLLGSSSIISSAVAHAPWNGAGGRPLANVSEYAKVMSWVNIMYVTMMRVLL